MEVKIVEPHENNDNTKEQKIYDILAYLMFNSLGGSGPFVVATNLLARLATIVDTYTSSVILSQPDKDLYNKKWDTLMLLWFRLRYKWANVTTQAPGQYIY
ncbi:hypothetical protein TEQG_01624 [Trichophyton equinum CBS 127.97]|uniref:Uncharacterized protein n=1 Tax=Trichophyton equinum (strain ATCC MYA-4606 / CBS 127.97) TaxID=559882 RepID=F2PKZ1_TRIEC|nr:hypothetical protein TEQG_01624 [Trichophyton equinum CBS 127.97]